MQKHEAENYREWTNFELMNQPFVQWVKKSLFFKREKEEKKRKWKQFAFK